MRITLYTLIRVKPPKAVPLIVRAEGKLGETQGPLQLRMFRALGQMPRGKVSGLNPAGHGC